MRLIVFSLGLLLLSACNNSGNNGNSNTGSSYDQMAKELCTCNQELISMYQEIQNLMMQEQQEEAMTLLDQFDVVAEAQEACASKVFQKYGEPSTPEEEEMAMKALQTHCPALVNMLSDLDVF